ICAKCGGVHEGGPEAHPDWPATQAVTRTSRAVRATILRLRMVKDLATVSQPATLETAGILHPTRIPTAVAPPDRVGRKNSTQDMTRQRFLASRLRPWTPNATRC